MSKLQTASGPASLRIVASTSPVTGELGETSISLQLNAGTKLHAEVQRAFEILRGDDVLTWG